MSIDINRAKHIRGAKPNKQLYSTATLNFFLRSVILNKYSSEGITFLYKPGHRITMATGDVRKRAHLFMKISIAVLHFNRFLFCVL